MTTRIAVAVADAMANAAGPLANGGSIKIYTGAQPATVATAASGTLLGTLTLSATAFGSSSSGTITANAITGDSSADNSGTAGWFRAFKSDGTTAIIDGSVTATGGGGDMQLDSVAIVAGGTISVSSWTITQPTG